MDLCTIASKAKICFVSRPTVRNVRSAALRNERESALYVLSSNILLTAAAEAESAAAGGGDIVSDDSDDDDDDAAAELILNIEEEEEDCEDAKSDEGVVNLS